MNNGGNLNAAVAMNKQTANSVRPLNRAANAVVPSLRNALAMKIITIMISIKNIMARKLALGLKGHFFPQFFNQAYIKQESEPGTNPWLIEHNINTLPLKGH